MNKPKSNRVSIDPEQFADASDPETITAVQIPATTKKTITVALADDTAATAGFQRSSASSQHIEIGWLTPQESRGLQRLFNGAYNLHHQHNGKPIASKAAAVRALLHQLGE